MTEYEPPKALMDVMAVISAQIDDSMRVQNKFIKALEDVMGRQARRTTDRPFWPASRGPTGPVAPNIGAGWTMRRTDGWKPTQTTVWRAIHRGSIGVYFRLTGDLKPATDLLQSNGLGLP